MKKHSRTLNDSSPKQAVLAEPVTFRLPKVGTTDSFFGCARTFWNAHVLPTEDNKFKPPIKSISTKEPGAKRGIRLIVFSSAKAYFLALADEQNKAGGRN